MHNPTARHTSAAPLISKNSIKPLSLLGALLICALLIAALLIASAALGEVYKSVDPQGRVSYGDKKTPAATAITIETTNTTPAAASPNPEPMPMIEYHGDEAEPTNYRTLAISAPADNTIIANGLAPFWVTVAVRPKLAAGHLLLLLVDDQVTASSSTSQIEVASLSRGQHSLQVRISDASGRPLKHSKIITLFAYRP
ncbi:MAG: hypothetical protein ACI9WS_001409 [Paraglaciecola psychrophila]|jgi:hypothetical protein